VGTLSQEQVALLTDYDPDSAYSIAYHTIYTNICFNWNIEQHKQYAVLLTSPAAPQRGAAAAANIAIAAAQNGTPAILVDADLHNPGLQQRFGIGEGSGLSELLAAGMITPQQIKQHLHRLFIPNLYLLYAGKALQQSHEVSRLLSAKLEEILASLRQILNETESKPGMIIFNSPPVLSGIDASLIASHVDSTFLLITSGRTTRTQAKRAQEQLQRAHARLTGMIMLDV